MSFLGGGNSRPDPNRQDPKTDSNAPRSETTFLGEASQFLGKLPDSQQPAPQPPVFAGKPLRGAALPQSGPTPPDRCTNVVASGSRWQGTLSVDDSVRVEGVFAGEIQAKGTVHVSEGAEVDAKIRAAFVVVSGNFRGEIRCEQRVDLLPRSRVNGEVITKVLSVQEGAILDGRVQMTGGIDAELPRAGSSRQNRLADADAADRRERAGVQGNRAE
jgi:cytoskeletal protein CcmA (bactofilin family)